MSYGKMSYQPEVPGKPRPPVNPPAVGSNSGAFAWVWGERGEEGGLEGD